MLVRDTYRVGIDKLYMRRVCIKLVESLDRSHMAHGPHIAYIIIIVIWVIPAEGGLRTGWAGVFP